MTKKMTTHKEKWLEKAEESLDGEIVHLLILRQEIFDEGFDTVFISNRIKSLLRQGR